MKMFFTNGGQKKDKQWSVLRRSLFACLGLSAVLDSCQKSGTEDNKPAATISYLSSIRSYSPQFQVVDSFKYDDAHRVAVWTSYSYDSTNGIPLTDQLQVAFSFTGNNPVPASYTYTHALNAPMKGVHQLSYDGQNRIIKDTALNGTGFVTYFSYPGNSIAINLFFSSGYPDKQLDTLFISGGNVIEERLYFMNSSPTTDSLVGAPQFGYSSYANPAYHAEIASTIGPLLHTIALNGFGGYSDFISKNAVNKVGGLGDEFPQGTTINFNLTADSQGRLAFLTAGAVPADNDKTVFTYY